MDKHGQLLSQPQWKLAASTTQTLCHCLMTIDITILSNGVVLSTSKFIIPYFTHQKLAKCSFAKHAMISPSNPHSGMRYHYTESHMVKENIISLKHL